MNSTVKDEIWLMPLAKVVATFQTLSQVATDNGQQCAPQAVREWMKSYEQAPIVREFFVKRKEHLETLTKNALSALKRQDAEKAEEVTKRFCLSLKTWDRVAQPIQLIRQGEGTTDPETERVFEMSRDFSLSLNNEHGETGLAAEVVEMQRLVFKEAGRLDQHLEQDEKALAQMLRQQKEMQQQMERTPHVSPFSGRIGVARRTVVEVTDEHIRVGSRTIHPDKVTGLRWGGIQYGMGSYYDIWVAGKGQELHVQIRRRKIYEEMVQCLWEGCGMRIATEIYHEVGEGRN